MTEIIPDNIPLETEGTSIEQIMEREPFACPMGATLGEACGLLIEHGVSGMPVVDDKQRVVGFISDGDIMRAVAQHRAHSIFNGDAASMLYFDAAPLEDKIAELKTRNVMELATSKVVCATPNESIGRVANTLSKRKFKKLPVVNADGTLVGIIRRSAILRYVFSVMFVKEE